MYLPREAIARRWRDIVCFLTRFYLFSCSLNVFLPRWCTRGEGFFKEGGGVIALCFVYFLAQAGHPRHEEGDNY